MNDEYSPTTKRIFETYFNIETGLSSNPKQLFEKFEKTIPLKKIKDVLNKIKNKQIKASKKEEKLFIPIIAEPQWFQCDLTFYSQYKKINHGYHVIMNIININSRKLYSYFMKNKKTNTIIENFKKFLKDCNHKINVLECDAGKEYESGIFQKLCDENKIKLILFDKKDWPNAISIVERVNKTIRDLINDYMISYKTKKFYDVYDKLLKNYNDRIHSSIGMKPNDVDEEKEQKISNEKKNEYAKVKYEIKKTFEIGSFVRIMKKKKLFSKGPKIYFSKKIYKIIGFEDEGNKIQIESNGKIKFEFPWNLKLVDENIIENPYLDINKDNQLQKQKKIIDKQKEVNKQNRKLKQENLDIKDIEKQKKLSNALKKLS